MIVIIASMVGFALIHSITADHRLKARVQQWMGERVYYGFYRLVYNGLSVLLLAPITLYMATAESHIIWQIPATWQPVLLAIQAVGLVGLVVSLLQIDWLRFAGLRQVIAYFRGDILPLPHEPLQLRGVYGLVRHPLYLFSLMALWPMSIMTDVAFVYNLMISLYFIIGSLIEERRMVRAFGADYVAYQQRVPWLVPLPRLRRSSSVS